MLVQELAKSDYVATDNISNGKSNGTAQKQQQQQQQQPKPIWEAKNTIENKKEDDDEGEIGVDVI